MIEREERGRRRDICREGSRGERDIEWKGEAFREWKEEDREEEKIEYLPLKERVKSLENLPNARYYISRNYYTKLSLVYYVAQKWVNYRDTGVSKNKAQMNQTYEYWIVFVY